MRCPNCGNENPPDYMFCDECGARLMESAETSAGADAGHSSVQVYEPAGASTGTGPTAGSAAQVDETSGASSRYAPQMPGSYDAPSGVATGFGEPANMGAETPDDS